MGILLSVFAWNRMCPALLTPCFGISFWCEWPQPLSYLIKQNSLYYLIADVRLPSVSKIDKLFWVLTVLAWIDYPALWRLTIFCYLKHSCSFENSDTRFVPLAHWNQKIILLKMEKKWTIGDLSPPRSYEYLKYNVGWWCRGGVWGIPVV